MCERCGAPVVRKEKSQWMLKITEYAQRLIDDLDDLDYNGLHVFYEEEGKVLAYLRAFPKEDSDHVVQMGRFLTINHGTGLGGRLLIEGLHQIVEKMNPKEIYIHAQCYATGFYERAGFQICSEEFLEDDIPHVEMRLYL